MTTDTTRIFEQRPEGPALPGVEENGVEDSVRAEDPAVAVSTAASDVSVAAPAEEEQMVTAGATTWSGGGTGGDSIPAAAGAAADWASGPWWGQGWGISWSRDDGEEGWTNVY